MCGIAGYTGQIKKSILDQMQYYMYHRGPDAVGYYQDDFIGMTMRRLSIIDIENGNQPFKNSKGVVVFQNGEIYNYKKIRKTLKSAGYKFSTDCDTEILLHGYDHWGFEKLLKIIDGMFALAIYDSRNKLLYLARDRFGEKPLFYTKRGTNFAYSSNLKSLKALDWTDFSMSMEALQYYITLHYVPGSLTIFNNIKKVLPGEYLIINIEDNSIKKKKYYSVKLDRFVTHDEINLIDLISDSVEKRLNADVPVGIFLSGGIDSALITAIASRKHPNISTFSMGFETSQYDESYFAKIISKHCNTNHHHFKFNEESFMSLIPEVARYLDEPIGDQALLPVYWLSKEAREYVKVVLSGEGGDEIFGGYSYYKRFAEGYDGREHLKSLIFNVSGMTPSGFPLVTSLKISEMLLGKLVQPLNDFDRDLIKKLNTARDPLQRATTADLLTWLPDDLLVKFDRMTMAHSIEGRAPYLQKDIVEHGLNFRSNEKYFGDAEKVILKRAAKIFLPKKILTRKKQGFVLPMESWLSSWFSTYEPKDYVNYIDFPMFDKRNLINILSIEKAKGITNPRLIFSLVMLMEWYSNFTGIQ